MTKIYNACFALLLVATGIVLFGVANAGEVVTLEPVSVPKPFKNRFSHSKLVPANAEWLYTAGQTGRDVDGRIGDDIEEQADFAMRNLFNIVKEAGMDSADVIKMTIYFIDPAHLPIIVAARVPAD